MVTTKMVYKMTEEHKRRIGIANSIRMKAYWASGKVNTKILEQLKKNNRIKKEKLGYVNSPEARLKLSNSLKKIWSERKENPNIKKGWFKTGIDNRRTKTMFKEGHEVTEQMHRKMKEKRKLQICPKADTLIEIKVQNYLKQLGFSFFTHQYMNIEHSYQCDIFIPDINLVIECDGDYYHHYPIGKQLDKVRTEELIAEGFQVLRLWEHEIKTMDIDKFKRKLKGGMF